MSTIIVIFRQILSISGLGKCGGIAFVLTGFLSQKKAVFQRIVRIQEEFVPARDESGAGNLGNDSFMRTESFSSGYAA